MGDQIIYLEKYIENSGVMPPELTRILNTIKDLDFRYEELAHHVQESFHAILSTPPGPPRKSSTDSVEEMRTNIHQDQTMLIHWSEEKLQLANTGLDLVSQQLDMIDQDIDALSRELDGPLGLADDYDMPMSEEPPPRRGGSRLQYAPSVETLNVMPSIDIRPSRKDRGGGGGGTLSRDQSGFGSEGGYGTGSDALAWDSGRKPTQRRQNSMANAITPAAAAPTQAEGYQSKRRAAQAAVHATAAAVAALDDDEYGGAGGAMPMETSLPGGGGLAVGGGATQADDVLKMYAATAPLVPGLNHAASRPQAPGRLLSPADIGEQLVGRKAEVYWPAENLWYLVEIKSVDPITHVASIIYTTGEAESLNLEDICKDGHMSLINL